MATVAPAMPLSRSGAPLIPVVVVVQGELAIPIIFLDLVVIVVTTGPVPFVFVVPTALLLPGVPQCL